MSFRFPFMSMQMWVISIGVVIGALVLYAYMFGLGDVEGMETSTDTKGTAECLLFSATWCPHCQKLKPTWEKIAGENNGKVINGYTVKMTEVDCTNEDEETKMLIEKYGVSGYPTIKMVKPDGSVVNLDAKPTESSLTQFINDSLN